MIYEVVLSKRVEKQLRKVPGRILVALDDWIHAVELTGLKNVRKNPGYHDEPLKGKRQGQRSIRLSLHYRAIYTIKEKQVRFAYVEEVHKHDY